MESHINQLVSFLDNLEATEEERVWLKRTSEGELDESRLTEALTGEAAVYKRRGMEKRELTTGHHLRSTLELMRLPLQPRLDRFSSNPKGSASFSISLLPCIETSRFLTG